MTRGSNSPNQWESIDWNKRNTTTTTTTTVRGVVAYQQHFQTGVGGVGSLVKDLYCCCCCCWIDTVRQEGGRRVGIQDVIDTHTNVIQPPNTHTQTGSPFHHGLDPNKIKTHTSRSLTLLRNKRQLPQLLVYQTFFVYSFGERYTFCLERVSL